jgi:hypothetical protein
MGFAPILNPMQLMFREPVEIIPGHSIRQAGGAEVEQIREMLDGLNAFKGFSPAVHYECREITEPSATGGTESHYESLPASEWRYYVMEYSTKSSHLPDLQTASNVADVNIIAPYVFLHAGGESGYPHKVAHFLSYLSFSGDRPQVTRDMVLDVGAAYEEMLEVREAFPEVGRALSVLDQLHLLPRGSEFEVLGLFSVIEMLITHNPSMKDIGDSITHQMKGKMPLLSKRFRRPLDYSRFGGIPEENVWSLLYGYRSRLAHGGEVDFRAGAFKQLVSAMHALGFLHQAARSLIRHYFKEPQLIRDLKAV